MLFFVWLQQNVGTCLNRIYEAIQRSTNNVCLDQLRGNFLLIIFSKMEFHTHEITHFITKACSRYEKGSLYDDPCDKFKFYFLETCKVVFHSNRLRKAIPMRFHNVNRINWKIVSSAPNYQGAIISKQFQVFIPRPNRLRGKSDHLGVHPFFVRLLTKNCANYNFCTLWVYFRNFRQVVEDSR